MLIAEDIKELVYEIASSYETRVSAVSRIIENAQRVLEDFKTEGNEASNQLKETLAVGESLRRKDFDNMMKDIFDRHTERQKQAKDLLRTYLKEQRDLALTLKKAVEGSISIESFTALLGNIQTRHKQREEEISNMLGDLQREHEETTTSLCSLLYKEKKTTLEDFKEVVTRIRSSQRGWTKGIGGYQKVKEKPFRKEATIGG